MPTPRTEDPRFPSDFIKEAQPPPVTTSYGVTFEFLQRLLRELGGNYGWLQTWIAEYVAEGSITREQAGNIIEYVRRAGTLSEISGLPAGSSFNQIAGRVQSRGLKISPEDRAFLGQGLEMERGLAEATAILKEPKEELTRVEKFQRALRYQERYRDYVGEQLGYDPQEQVVPDDAVAAFEPADPEGRALKIRAEQVKSLEEAAAGRERGFREDRREEEPEPFEPFTPPRFGGVAGSPTWQNWFERKYSGIVRTFQEREPLERTEEAFGTFLGQQTKKEREQWWRQGSFQRGERPSAFAPRIRTVDF